MKKIIIVRHAKSSWGDFKLADFDRPLDERGLRDAPKMAKRLSDEGHIPEKIISSNALRAKTTAKYFGKEFDLEVNLAASLYHGEPDDYLDILAEQDEDINSVALFGHNPGITYIANLIKPGSTDNIPTCGIIVAEADDNITWAKLRWQNMHIVGLFFPKNSHHG